MGPFSATFPPTDKTQPLRPRGRRGRIRLGLQHFQIWKEQKIPIQMTYHTCWTSYYYQKRKFPKIG